MQATNYLRQITQQVIGEPIFNNDIQLFMAEWVGRAKQAVKIILPKDGIIFSDDRLSNIFAEFEGDLKTPFDDMLFEFPCEGEIQKVAILVSKYTDTYGLDVLRVAAMSYYRGAWNPHRSFGIPVVNGIEFRDDLSVYIGFIDFDLVLHKYISNDDIIGDYIQIAKPIASFINFCACSNVEITPLAQSKVRTSIGKKGKLPFDSYHIVTIKPSTTKKSSNTGGDGHASPREHLRRGHIRRLETKSIWVNSCVVGNASLGKVTTAYKVVK